MKFQEGTSIAAASGEKTYPPRNQFNTFMIVQESGINARINPLAHSFCSKPPAEINGIIPKRGRGRKRRKS